MENPNPIYFQGEEYRDDRAFVLDIIKGEITHIRRNTDKSNKMLKTAGLWLSIETQQNFPNITSFGLKPKREQKNMSYVGSLLPPFSPYRARL